MRAGPGKYLRLAALGNVDAQPARVLDRGHDLGLAVRIVYRVLPPPPRRELGVPRDRVDRAHRPVVGPEALAARRLVCMRDSVRRGAARKREWGLVAVD